ncbi:MAG TPA: HAD family hydrolase [Anaerolineales bacterium]
MVVELAMFDLGNTLFFDRPGSWPKVYAQAESALWRSLKQAGLRVSPEDLYGRPDTLLGYYYALRGSGIQEPGAFAVLKGLILRQGLSIEDSAISKALRAMYAETQRNWRVDARARAVLKTLLKRDVRLGVVSNGSDDANAFEMLERAKLRSFFDLVLTSAAHGRRKPDASIFQSALAHFQVEPAQAVMVGDSYEADIVGAHGLGMHTIWVRRREAPAPEHPAVQPDAIVAAVREVPPLLFRDLAPNVH